MEEQHVNAPQAFQSSQVQEKPAMTAGSLAESVPPVGTDPIVQARLEQFAEHRRRGQDTKSSLLGSLAGMNADLMEIHMRMAQAVIGELAAPQPTINDAAQCADATKLLLGLAKQITQLARLEQKHAEQAEVAAGPALSA